MTSRERALASGGVVGPFAFVSAWAIAGAVGGFSPVDDAISDLAAVGASTRVAMTVGFVVFGLGLIAFGLALRSVLDGPAWVAAVVTGAATLGVAATPLGGWSGDGVHAAFAGIGYLSLVAVPMLASFPMFRAGRVGWARASALDRRTRRVPARSEHARTRARALATPRTHRRRHLDRRGRGRPRDDRRGSQTGSSPRSVTRWMTRCWSPKSPATACWVVRLSQKPMSPAFQW